MEIEFDSFNLSFTLLPVRKYVGMGVLFSELVW